GLADRARARRTDARHLADARRIAVQHLQGLDAEAVDDARGELGPDALDEAGAEVAADAFPPRGADLRVARGAGPLAPGGGGLDLPRHAQLGADRDAPQRAHHGDHGAVARQLEARHRELPVAARVDDALEGPLERAFRLALRGSGARPIEEIHPVMQSRCD